MRGSNARCLALAFLMLANFLSPSVAIERGARPAPASNLTDPTKEEFRATAVLAMRVQRFANIGTICRLLSPQDDAAIRANVRSMLEQRSQLALGDRAAAATYLEGLADGAFRAADLRDVTDPGSCRRFAAPGGALDRVLTWNGKPPKSVNGIMMSSRTTP